MKKKFAAILAGSSMLAFAPLSYAQSAPEPEADSAASEGDIVVTARRRSEQLQDVPQTVNVVTDQALQDYAITNFEDISELIPGLNMNTGVGGYRSDAVVRGVENDVTAQASGPTTAFYVNEAPINSNVVFNQSYDLGQIEVLKGPQGTARGISAPSGAFTITTRPADPAAGFTGYVSVQTDDDEGYNVQGAINVPIIEDILAIRLAGVTDETRQGTPSIFSGDPTLETTSVRGSVTFTPSDSFRARVTYQDNEVYSESYGGAGFGPGECAAVPAPGDMCTPTETNSFAPPIARGAFVSNTDAPDAYSQDNEWGTLNLEWEVMGAQLIYNMGYQRYGTDNHDEIDGRTNLVRPLVSAHSPAADDEGQEEISHEFRVQSAEPLFNGLLDYSVGYFRNDLEGLTFQATALDRWVGSFGPASVTLDPANRAAYFNGYTADPNQYQEAYTTVRWNWRSRENTEEAIFANIDLHLLNDRLNLSAGYRWIEQERHATLDLGTRGGYYYGGVEPTYLQAPPSLVNLGPTPGGGCNAASFNGATTVSGLFGASFGLGGGTAVTYRESESYPGTCDAVIAPGGSFQLQNDRTESDPEVWSASASFDFTDDTMVYFYTGTAWRGGGAVLGSPTDCLGGLTSCFNPTQDETSQNYEIGFKTYLFDRRAYFEISAFQQEFDGYIVRGTGGAVPYRSDDPTDGVRSGTFVYNADVIITGFDVLARYDITDSWNAGFSVSYNDAEYDGSPIPCRDTNFDGVPDNDPAPWDVNPSGADDAGVWDGLGGPAGPALCAGSGQVTPTSLWNANLRSEYNFPIFSSLEGFVRGNLNYYPETTVSDGDWTIDSYYILNLYAGIRSEGRDWELQIFARNVLDDDTIRSDSTAVNGVSGASWPGLTTGGALNENPFLANAPYFPIGAGVQYGAISRVEPRQIGARLRYNF